MGIKNSIVTSGLTFMYDMSSDRSFKGKPTTNYAHNANPERFGANPLQGDTWSATALGTWDARHQDAIRVFSHAGSELTSKINTGVVDWTNTYHGIWTFDEELGYPVVTMRDIGDGSWMYAGFGFDATIDTPTKLGLTTGSNYVISWDQWTTNISKSAHCGLYGQNATNTGNGFHDGLSNTATTTAFNTKTHTWQRLYAIFTISANRGLNATWSQYNYGHYTTRGVTKVANFQLEVGNTPSKFLYSTNTGVTDSRSSTEAIVDVAGSNSITAVIEYDATDTNTFEFNGSSSYLGLASNFMSGKTSGSWEFWCYPDTVPPSGQYHQLYVQESSQWMALYNFSGGIFFGLDLQKSGVGWFDGSGGSATGATTLSAGDITAGSWYHVAYTWTGSTAKVYLNGVETASVSTGSVDTLSAGAAPREIGRRGTSTTAWDGKIATAKVYERALTASEVKQNYNALKSKYV